MPHLSKRVIEPKIKQEIFDTLTFVVNDLQKISDTSKFLESLLSETERLMIAKRIAMAFLLQHHVESQDIQDILKLTPQTIARMKLWIQTHQEGFDLIFDKLKKLRRINTSKEILYKILNYALKAAAGRIPTRI